MTQTSKPISLVPCGFCYEGRDTEPVRLYNGKVKWLCPKCRRDLIENPIFKPTGPRIVAECWTCATICKLTERRRCSACEVGRTIAYGAAGLADDEAIHPASLGPECRAAGHDVRPVEVKP